MEQELNNIYIPNSDDIKFDVKYVHLKWLVSGISVYTHEQHTSTFDLLRCLDTIEEVRAEAYAQGMLQTPIY